MSPGHGASLSTTAGITSVITGVMAAILAGQAPSAGAGEGAIACAAIGALALGAGGLYLARNAVCQAMDAQAAGLPGAGVFAARALTTYHLGMAGVFTGLALAASWRLALPHGTLGWAGAMVASAMAIKALAEALAWAGETTRRTASLPPRGGGEPRPGAGGGEGAIDSAITPSPAP